MTKKLTIMLTVLLLVLTACTPSVEAQLEKAAQLVKDKDFNEAIEIYEKVLDEDDTNFEAWDGLVKAYMKDKEYKDAEEELEKFFEAVKDNFEEDEDVDYEDWLDEINDHAKEIMDEDEDVGDWYNELNPPMIDLSMVPYNADLDQPLELDIPKGVDVYYTLDGSKPSDKDEKYKDGIVFTEEGDIELTVVAINEFGIAGEENYTYVYVYAMPEAPTLDLASGTYDNEVTLYVENYDYDTMDVYYTTDGSDPVLYGYYYWEEDGIRLVSGDYDVQLYYYDYNTGMDSAIGTYNYTINNPNAVTEYTTFNVAVYDVNASVYSEVEYALYDIYYYEDNMDVTIYEVYDLDSLILDLESGYADAVYTNSMYVEDLAAIGLLADAEDIISFGDYDYYNLAEDAGYYNGDYYTMPVTIDPDIQLYANYYDVYDMNVDTWDQLVAAANDGYSEYNFLYPEADEGGYWLYSFYLGYGGYYQFDGNGNFVLDRQPLIDAMQFAYDIPIVYGLGFEGMDYDTFTTSIENENVTMVLGNPSLMSVYDYYGTYTPVGPMPLPNGEYAASVNNVNGLHVNSQVMFNDDKQKVARVAYRYLADSYYANYIANYTNGLPAITTSVDTDYLWLSGDIEDYEFAINYNITAPYTYQMEDMFSVMSFYMNEVFYNSMDVNEAVDAIIAEVGAYN